MLRRIISLAAFWLAAASCQLPPERSTVCDVCLTADVCCAAHTANVESNCQLHATCEGATTRENQALVADGCAYYLRIASTPPAPAACGPHPD